MPTASTSPLNFWDNKSWHYKVHQRLGETLYYFLVRARPLDPEDAAAQLQKMFTEKRLGSVRVFPIFGSYDFMIRAWIHPSIYKQFKDWLDNTLNNISPKNSTYPFEVDSVDLRANRPPDINRTLLENLDENAIRDVQMGKNPELMGQLLDGNIVISRRRTNGIGFFTSVYLEDENKAINEGMVAAVKHFLLSHPGLQRTSIYRGFGFCSVLIKSEAAGFFEIASLPNHIGKLYKQFGAHTETFLIHGPSHTAGDEALGEATFYALRGRDLFVLSVIPELYDLQSPRCDAVARLLISEGHQFRFTQKDKTLLRDYLLSYIEDDSTKMATTLFALFHKVEGYLKNTHREFIGRKGFRQVKEIYEKAHIPESRWDALTLADLIHVYMTAIKLFDTTNEFKNLLGGWENFTNLRNDLMHAKVDVLANWDELLKRLMPYLPRLRELISLIEQATGKQYDGIY